jgi:hypothetical protein
MNWAGAKCRDIPVSGDDDLFFDDDPTDAVEFCRGTWDGVPCPIREECLRFALVNNCREGVWGGCSEQERKLIRREEHTWSTQATGPAGTRRAEPA